VRGFDPVARELRALALQERDSTITMLFNHYAPPVEWLGVRESKGRPAEQIPDIVKPEIHQAVMKRIADDCDPRRFIPHVQMHEIDAWLFAGPDKMAAVFEQPNLEANFRKIVAECGGCKKINDNPESAPSRRIEKPPGRYKKGDVGTSERLARLSRMKTLLAEIRGAQLVQSWPPGEVSDEQR
jgi:hypothetical protein